jgi:hypothetical protein
MCPACLAAAAVTAAKVASIGGLTAFGMKKLLSPPRSESTVPIPPTPGDPDDHTENRISR